MKSFGEQFIHKIASLSSIDDLRREFSKCLADMDMSQFSYHVVRHKSHKNLENFYVTDYPIEWQNRYIEQNYFDDDPLLRDYSRYKNPFVWGDRNDTTSIKARQMFNEATDFGLVGGIGLPIPGPGNSLSVVTLCSSELNLQKIKKLHASFNKDLFIAALLFHSAAMALNIEDEMHFQYDLTKNEVECLKWLCSGKSNFEMSLIFNISESAVKKRLINIYSKLDVSNRSSAILKALKYKVVED